MSDEKMSQLTPDEALALLKEGNRLFLEDATYQPPMDRLHRLHLAVAQRPFAAYLSCSDSRVPPELLFERGLGELFIVRNAGNILCSSALGSLEFAIQLINEAHVAVSPGAGFGEHGDGHVRIALVENEQRIRQAARNIRKFLAKRGVKEIAPAAAE